MADVEIENRESSDEEQNLLPSNLQPLQAHRFGSLSKRFLLLQFNCEFPRLSKKKEGCSLAVPKLDLSFSCLFQYI